MNELLEIMQKLVNVKFLAVRHLLDKHQIDVALVLDTIQPVFVGHAREKLE